MEFTAGEPKSMTFDLFVDLYENKGDVHTQYTLPLLKMAEVDTMMKRPPMVSVTWGKQQQFKGVIENVSVKYTLFLEDGTPVRASVNLKVREAAKASFSKKSDDKDKND
jgi:hypothetical protein